MHRALALLTEFLVPDRGPVRGVPSMDGGLTPNDELDALGILSDAGDLRPEDVLVDADGSVLATAGAALWRLDGDGPARKVADLPGDARGMTLRGDGSLLVCVDRAGLVAVDRGGAVHEVLDAQARAGVGVLSAVAVSAGEVFVSEVSRRREWSEWPYALYEGDAEGRILHVREDGSLRTVAEGLVWPWGLCDGREPGTVVVTESFAHRISTLDTGSGARRPLAERLPAYPARVHPSAAGLWVAFFGVRTHLVEFVLHEDDYRRRMIQQVPVDEWLLPALRRTGSVREPLQVGGVKHLGEVKPWSPPRSYGLVAELGWDGDFVRSMHSRPGGWRHGTTAASEASGVLAVACAGAEAVLVTSAEGGES
ncbi:SMP-30/gluconolactonase/LRE family protein [Nocardioides campestrisoli]|uniref:SMP-30/gluconolactonase/LRE family protein n=1 Tax=Nocardioides campestrisoli TaxID=2736757 RepID=UPI00163D8F9F|nr:SMP-30/gluconolactonase/LRE family protein [Nocardioides campestrisoli]